jgi:hypothetical protein
MGCCSSKTEDEKNDERMKRLVGSGYVYMPPENTVATSNASSTDYVGSPTLYPNRPVPSFKPDTASRQATISSLMPDALP